MNTILEDPEVRYWRRISAAVSFVVVAVFLAGLAIVAGTTPGQHPMLSVNCATGGMPGTVFDDSGTHASLCAGHASFERGRLHSRLEATPRMPAPDAAAVAEPLPPTF